VQLENLPRILNVKIENLLAEGTVAANEELNQEILFSGSPLNYLNSVSDLADPRTPKQQNLAFQPKKPTKIYFETNDQLQPSGKIEEVVVSEHKEQDLVFDGTSSDCLFYRENVELQPQPCFDGFEIKTETQFVLEPVPDNSFDLSDLQQSSNVSIESFQIETQTSAPEFLCETGRGIIFVQ